ncbi:hypothetical protein HPB50_011787 [Hyalomma asiaticum]|uniref:Uncharacterized protein n=1 Tax=Hyalomma asiaticum TaxID=266040 RepID=A0ACB7S614_HYAAI|nr:hypothetical protein HPB50_011787 [Hyalomma asiaticum]
MEAAAELPGETIGGSFLASGGHGGGGQEPVVRSFLRGPDRIQGSARETPSVSVLLAAPLILFARGLSNLKKPSGMLFAVRERRERVPGQKTPREHQPDGRGVERGKVRVENGFSFRFRDSGTLPQRAPLGSHSFARGRRPTDFTRLIVRKLLRIFINMLLRTMP